MARYTFGPFVLDTNQGSLSGEHGQIHIRPRAYDLLVVLVERAPAAVKRHEAVDAVWGVEHLSPGSLTQTVSELRDALGDDAGKPRYIETLHRRGYRFLSEVRSGGDASEPPPSPPAVPGIAPPVASPGPAAPQAGLVGLRRHWARVLACVVSLAVVAGVWRLRRDPVAQAPVSGLAIVESPAQKVTRRSGQAIGDIIYHLELGLANNAFFTLLTSDHPGEYRLEVALTEDETEHVLNLILVSHEGDVLLQRELGAATLPRLEADLDAAIPELRYGIENTVFVDRTTQEDSWLGYLCRWTRSVRAAQCVRQAVLWRLDMRFELAEQALRQALEVDPIDLAAWCELAKIQWLGGEAEIARKSLDRARESAYSNDSDEQLTLAACEHLIGGALSDALNALQRLLERYPDSQLLRYEIAQHLRFAGRPRDALPLIAELSDSGWMSSSVGVAELAVSVYLETGDTAAAREWAARAVTRAPFDLGVARLSCVAQAFGSDRDAQAAAGHHFLRVLGSSESHLRELSDVPMHELRVVEALLPPSDRGMLRERARRARELVMSELGSGAHPEDLAQQGLVLLMAEQAWNEASASWAGLSPAVTGTAINLARGARIAVRQGQSDQARQLLGRSEAVWAEEHGLVRRNDTAVEIAALHTALGDSDQALDWLARVTSRQPGHKAWLACDPAFASLQPDRRFQHLVAPMQVATLTALFE